MEIHNSTNPNKLARLAGILYLPPWILSLVAMILRNGLIVPGDSATTAVNILESEPMYQLSIVFDLTVQVVFVFLVLVLYKLFAPVDKPIAKTMVVLFLVSVPIAMLNMLNQVAIPILVSNKDMLVGFSADQLQSLICVFDDLHRAGVMIAYLFWGLWLFPLGQLVYRSGFLPKVLGIYLMISCFGYLIDFVLYFFLPNVSISVNMFTGWAELVLCLWLLIKGVKIEQWHALVSKPS